MSNPNNVIKITDPVLFEDNIVVEKNESIKKNLEVGGNAVINNDFFVNSDSIIGNNLQVDSNLLVHGDDVNVNNLNSFGLLNAANINVTEGGSIFLSGKVPDEGILLQSNGTDLKNRKNRKCNFTILCKESIKPYKFFKIIFLAA